jgi:hypothetical protein
MTNGSRRRHWLLLIAHCLLTRNEGNQKWRKSISNEQLAIANPTCVDPTGRRLVGQGARGIDLLVNAGQTNL